VTAARSSARGATDSFSQFHFIDYLVTTKI
jgi:hypothetical protein